MAFCLNFLKLLDIEDLEKIEFSDFLFLALLVKITMRALYHNPQFLILDDPTSSLDKANRKFIYDLILKLKETAAILIISHNLEDLNQISDQVLVLYISFKFIKK